MEKDSGVGNGPMLKKTLDRGRSNFHPQEGVRRVPTHCHSPALSSSHQCQTSMTPYPQHVQRCQRLAPPAPPIFPSQYVQRLYTVRDKTVHEIGEFILITVYLRI